MNVTFRAITKEDIRQFFAWRYAPPYNVYNLAEEPAADDFAYYLDRRYQCYAMLDETGSFIAFCSLGTDGQVPGGDYRTDALDIGLGLRPDLTGHGHGIDYVQHVIEFARNTFAPNALRVTIAAFNLRAQKVWQKAGFIEVSRFGRTRDQMPFIIYLRPNLQIDAQGEA